VIARPSEYERAKARMERAAVAAYVEIAAFSIPRGWVYSVDAYGDPALPIFGPNGEEVREVSTAHGTATVAIFAGRRVGTVEERSCLNWHTEIDKAIAMARKAARKAGRK
jgi:hypothetical protein